MAQSSGMKARSCPYCGQRYQLTNWMKRQQHPQYDASRRTLLDNTHLIACHRKAQEKA